MEKETQCGISLATEAEALATHRKLLREVADQMDSWANESRLEGWSTHQVDANRQWAEKIRAFMREN